MLYAYEVFFQIASSVLVIAYSTSRQLKLKLRKRNFYTIRMVQLNSKVYENHLCN